MEWWQLLLVTFGALLALMLTGIPVAFAFLVVSIVCAYLFWNGPAGLDLLALAVTDSVTQFTLLPIPLFLLMGEVLFRSGIAPKLLEVLDSWIGRVPGRLSLVSIGGGVMFATLTGSGMAGTAMLGKILLPQMERLGYRKPMTIGPIMSAGSLAIMLPPSALAVLLAGIAGFSIGDFLVAIIVPGLVLAGLYATYIVVRAYLQPELAPPSSAPPIELAAKLRNTLIYAFPLVAMIFLVVGVILLGVATPTEAAALGTVGAFSLAALYGGLSWGMVLGSLRSALSTTVMVFMIIVGSTAYSQILAFTGASAGLVELAADHGGNPLWIVAIMQIALLLLGTLMEPLSIAVLAVPIYFPIIDELGLSPLWFGAIMLLNMDMAARSPPFGLQLFVIKGVSGGNTTMHEVYRAAMPFLGCDLIAMALMIAFPPLTLWLPSQIG